MTNVVERDLQQVKCKAEDHGYRRSWKRKSQLVCSDSELPSMIKELLSGVLVTLPTSAILLGSLIGNLKFPSRANISRVDNLKVMGGRLQ